MNNAVEAGWTPVLAAIAAEEPATLKSDNIQKMSWGHVLWDTPEELRIPVEIQPDTNHHLFYFEEAENGGRIFGVPPRYRQTLSQFLDQYWSPRAQPWDDLEPLIDVYSFDLGLEEDNYWMVAVIIRKDALPAIRRVLDRRYRRWRRGQ